MAPPYRLLVSWLPRDHDASPTAPHALASCPACARPAACTSATWSARSATGCRCRSKYDCFYFVADWHALTSDYADTSQLDDVRVRQRRRLDRRRPRPGEEHVLHPVARARARRAVPAALDGRAGAVARARADLQGAAGEPEGQGPVVDRLPRLSAAADGRRRDLRRAVRAGRRGPGGAPRAGARGRAPLQQLLRRRARRAAAAAHDLRAPAGARRRQEDEQEPRQHDPPLGHAPTR